MKKKWLALAVCCALLISCMSIALPASANSLGDLDGDGSLTSTDARLVAYHALKKESPIPLEDPALADVDGDGKVTISDARVLLQYYDGSIKELSDVTSTDGGALPTDFLSFSEPWFPTVANDITIRLHYNTARYLMDGMVYIAYPADLVELVVEDTDGPGDPYNHLSDLIFVQVNPEWDEGVIAMGLYDPKGLAPGSGDFITLTFRAKTPDVTAFSISAWSDHMSVLGDTPDPAHTLRYTGSRETAVTAELVIPAATITPPTQTLYAVGDSLNLEGGCITYTYPDGTTEEQELRRDMVSGFDSSKPGVQTVTIACGSAFVTYEVEVVEPVVVYIGDVDLDGAITSTDARIVLQYYAGKFKNEDVAAMYDGVEDWAEVFHILADADEDGEITSTDARLILQYYAGKL